MPAVETGQSNGGFRAEELTRRNFQRITAEAVDRHAYAINELQKQLQARSEFMADLSVRVDGHAADLADLREKAEVLRIWKNRSVLGRLRWLVCGL